MKIYINKQLLLQMSPQSNLNEMIIRADSMT